MCPRTTYTYSFEPNPDWTRTMPPGAEIQAYFENVVEKYGLAPYLRFGEEVTRMDFIDGRWQLQTISGRRDEADFVVAATGVLHHPRLPNINGMERFKGELFHSARWDHSVALDGKRIAVVGNRFYRRADRVSAGQSRQLPLPLSAQSAVDYASHQHTVQ